MTGTHERSLAGKDVILTGASRGLGRVIARTLWHNGASLLLIARSNDALHALHVDLMSNCEGEQQAYILATDLAERDAVSKIMDTARQVWNKVDVLINNAAIIGPIGKVWQNDWEDWQTTVHINLFAPIELCRACVPWMIEHGGGKIINLSGGGATAPRPNLSAYATAKTGLVRFSETLAQEVRDRNIQVNCLAPGMMNTEMLQAILRAGQERTGTVEYNRAAQQASTSETALQRAADLCVFLASSASDGITGKLISAAWDRWQDLPEHADDLNSDIYTLRRIVPRDRGKDWG